MPQEFTLITGLSADLEQPTPQQIADALLDLPHVVPDYNYVILERTDPAACGVSASYLQTRPHRIPNYDGVFVVEYRDGILGRHYRGHIEEAGVPPLFRAYFNGQASWRDTIVWRDVSALFKDLHATLPPAELTSSFFPEGEWDAALEDKERRDQQFWEEWSEIANPVEPLD